MAFFYHLLAQMRVTATTPEEYCLFSNSYLAEIERMHAKVVCGFLGARASSPLLEQARRLLSQETGGAFTKQTSRCPFRKSCVSMSCARDASQARPAPTASMPHGVHL
jgi:hypothetical protein